jgi:predicted alpha/beta-fold hydrolase
MFLIAKDDPITKFGVVPMNDLRRNPNFMVGVTELGGHCEFFYSESGKRGQYGRYVPSVMLNYFSLVDKFN